MSYHQQPIPDLPPYQPNLEPLPVYHTTSRTGKLYISTEVRCLIVTQRQAVWLDRWRYVKPGDTGVWDRTVIIFNICWCTENDLNVPKTSLRCTEIALQNLRCTEFDLRCTELDMYRSAKCGSRSVSSMVPGYLSAFCRPIPSVPSWMRFAESGQLHFPRFRLTTCSGWAFVYVGSSTWNSLPSLQDSSLSLSFFQIPTSFRNIPF